MLYIMKKRITWVMSAFLLMGLMACGGSKNEKKNIEVFVDSIDSNYEELPDTTVAAVASDTTLMSERPDSTVKAEKQDTVTMPKPQTSMDAGEQTPELKTTSKRVYASSTDGYVNVRKQPTVKSEILGKLVKGDQGAEYVKTEGEWYQIKYQGQTGYVKSTYASFDNTTSSAEKAKTPIFFVVIASFENLDRAKAVDNQLGNEFKSPIYKYVENGTVRYRICEGRYDSKDKARARIRQLDEKFGKSDLWIWETSVEPICVFRP